MKAARLALRTKLGAWPTRPQLSATENADVCYRCIRHQLRPLGSSSTAKLDRPKDNASVPQSEYAREKLAARDFLLSVLSSTATKRDAKVYLSRFKQPKRKPELSEDRTRTTSAQYDRPEEQYHWRLNKSGVNLGRLYTYPAAIEESPVFTQNALPDKLATKGSEPLHLAVIKIRHPQALDAQTLNGAALTLAQLARLGMLSAVVVDCDEPDEAEQELGDAPQKWRQDTTAQAFRIANAINRHSKEGARVVDQVLAYRPLRAEVPHNVPVQGGVRVQPKKLLFAPLDNGIIPVVPPIAYTTDSKVKRVKADDVVLALTREFAGLVLPSSSMQEDWTAVISADVKHPVSLDRIIVLDPLGGLPARNKADRAHVFVNLEQEYEEIKEDLLAADKERAESMHNAIVQAEGKERHSVFGASNPISSFVEKHVSCPPVPRRVLNDQPELQENDESKSDRYVQNLDLIQQALALLPPTSSALLTTPAEAAGSALSTTLAKATTGVGTRLKKNVLIHNLFTDRPVISSSLPAARLQAEHTSPPTILPATFFKRGMPLTIIPDPRNYPWVSPGPEGSSLRLESDPRIDFPRLHHLIEDSFGRPLDVHHYLTRISGHIAGAIIAGEYEGGAILTWEKPSWDPSRPPVPYLDKFAVLRKSQGSGGVADIVFNAMVRGCFPEGVVWRSRNSNPVNKWYFERAVGTWRLPGSNWCMFWTGDEIDLGAKEHQNADERTEKEKRFKDYVDVCSGIEASWADREKPPD